MPIEVEIWDMPIEEFGSFVALVPPPLAIGSLELADGTWVKGFVCESEALETSPDITHHGAWKVYLRSLKD
jgi:allophanate hydrolase